MVPKLDFSGEQESAVLESMAAAESLFLHQKNATYAVYRENDINAPKFKTAITSIQRVRNEPLVIL